LRLQEEGGTLTDAILADVQRSCVAAAEKAGATIRA
jgi:hypothetical protein